MASWRIGLGALGTGFVGLTVFHKQVDQKYREYAKIGTAGGYDYLIENTNEDSIFQTLQTGDVVLFRRKMMIIKPWRSLLCYLSRQRLAGPYDHIGVIVNDQEENVPYVIEHGLGGVTRTAFDTRYLESLCDEIAVRRLSTRKQLSDAKVEAAEKYYEELISNQPSFFSRLYGLALAAARDLDYDKVLYFRKQKIEFLERLDYLRRGRPGESQKNIELMNRVKFLRLGMPSESQAHHLRASVRAGRVATKRAPLTPERKAAIEEEIQRQLEGRKRLDDELTSKENEARSRFFQGYNHSAEFAATLYQKLGLIPEDSPTRCYSVDNFVFGSAQTEGNLRAFALPLLDGTRLSHLYHLKSNSLNAH